MIYLRYTAQSKSKFQKLHFSRMSNKTRTNNKRQRVHDDGTVEEPWNKKQKQNLGFPLLFQMFEGKLPRYLLDDKIENKDEMKDVSLNIYGNAAVPNFLGNDVGQLCKYEESRVRRQLVEWKGKSNTHHITHTKQTSSTPAT